MKGDFSRFTFNPTKHYRGVHMQQGRVQLDADWNENLDILLHRIETETIDVIGACGIPVHDAGFGVVTEFKNPPLSQEEMDWLTTQGFQTLGKGDFYLTQGRAYVDGIQIENDNTVPFSQQPFSLPKGQGQLGTDRVYLLYLDVWERHITVIEDPAIREVALGGPDTATRTQVIWQARLEKVGSADDNLTCADDLTPWPDTSTGTLSARTQPEDQPDDPCAVPPSAGYKRLENQLYRVEIHQGSDAAAGPTFKWSRDNGSVVVAIAAFTVDGANTKIRTTSLGRDDVLSLHENDWIEVLDDATELAGKAGTLVQITKIDPDNILTLSGSITGYDLNGHPKVRRWDSDGEAILPNDYVALEGGVEVKFDLTGTYRTGDYWLIPARTIPGQYGEIEWPEASGSPAALLPFGITHHYCKLALLTFSGSSITDVEDCRKKFPPLTELPTGGTSCCSVTVGKGGDFDDIQQAVDARPADAKFWNVCLLPGEYKLQKPVIITQDGFALSGCGDQTVITGPSGQPIFAAQSVKTLRLEGLTFNANAPLGAFLLLECRAVTLRNCRGENVATKEKASDTADSPVVVALDCKEVEISQNWFRGKPTVLALGDSFEINDNFFTGGGVQVLFGSTSMWINHNRILKGSGPGIQLSGVFDQAEVTAFFKQALADDQTTDTAAEMQTYSQQQATRATRGVFISGNLIGGMEGSGILTLEQAFDLEELGEVSYLTIEHNQIVACASKPDLQTTKTRVVGGGINLSSVSEVTIHGNLVSHNGRGKPTTSACGIVVINGSNIEITDNEVLENGTDAQEIKSESGFQAGIAALYVFGNDVTLTDALNAKQSGGQLTMQLGLPALRVRGNKVVAPAGQALSALVMGTAQVTDNVFVTQRRLEQSAPLPGVIGLGACVQFFNFGYQEWLAGLVGGPNAGIHFDVGDSASVQNTAKVIPDGRTMFNNNQVTLLFPAQADPNYKPRFTYPAVLLFSLDDISLQGNQLQADPTPDWMLVNTLAWGTTLRATGNNFSEPAASAFFSYYSLANLMNITSLNTAVHCILTAATQSHWIEKDNLVLLTDFCEKITQSAQASNQVPTTKP